MPKAKQNPAQEIKTRLVLNFPGFEQTDSSAQLGRLRYGAEQTGKFWGFEISQGPLDHPDNSHYTITQMSSKGANWNCDTRLVQFRWNDIVTAYEQEAFPLGFLKNLKKYISFFTDGTVKAYRKASMRYWGFTIFPVLLALLFAIASYLVFGFFISNILINLVLTGIATLLLCKWPGDLLYVPLTIADWGFARDMANQKNQEIEARFEEFGTTVAREISTSNHDEIIIIGHSFGSLWAVCALSKALDKNPSLLKNKKIRFLALGSSMLKIALTPEAKFIRDHWQNVMNQSEVFWHEVQTKDDLIAFYKCDPFEQAGIETSASEYAITRIRFSKGMEKKRYKAMRKSFYRTHRQYILYYDTRVSFDYMLRLFGPFSAKTLAYDEEIHKRIDQHGSLH